MSDTGLYNSNKPKIDTNEQTKSNDVTLELGDIIEIHSTKNAELHLQMRISLPWKVTK